MTQSPFRFNRWPEGIIELLDDHHLAVLSDDPEVRRHFCRTVAEHLRSLADTTVVVINGEQAVDLDSFCRQLFSQLSLTTRGEGRGAGGVQRVIDALHAASPHPKRRYYLWDEAEAMLDTDVTLFSQLVNALVAVAAEREHLSDEPLVVERVIFVGGEKLGAYAEDVNGQFNRWLEADEAGSVFWEVASILDRPPVITYRIDA